MTAMARQLMFGDAAVVDNWMTPQFLSKAIDAVGVGDVVKFGDKLLNGVASVLAVGDTSELPEESVLMGQLGISRRKWPW
eukprot:CAMPEP_0113846084 /NCGR_PEP_ID=MMETSP0372-20130328/1113_1 /TAXON_ID=340204 /ORGANISM="Lankesteria abbotti" /LENGTH=79 /DNA_ID=CAMNT_0000815193 /DNA_START=642 /DNA_END=878 /DNA_ORIENTATION=- /assembly_acc=CAM_ASM_000359